MNGHDLEPALGHHVARHGGIDAARKQQRRPARAADGHAARARLLPGVQIGGPVAHLGPDHQVGVVHIHPQMGVALQQIVAQLGTNFRRPHREGLVRALGVDLKGFGCSERVIEIIGPGVHSLQAFFDHNAAADGSDAEHTRQTQISLVHINVVIHGRGGNGGLRLGDSELPEGGEPSPDIFHQNAFKGGAVGALERQLAVFKQNYFLHGGSSFFNGLDTNS
ncbi:hypothetical protein DSECCO2_543300 [anaerobic digester metagenome]